MTDLNVRLLGQFQVTWHGEAITKFSSDKVRALLAYLITDAHRPHRREALAALLWPEKSEETARSNLRGALSDLRRVLNDDRTDPHHIQVTRQTVQWNPDSPAHIDTLELLRASKLIPANPHSIEELKKLVSLYQGEFLEGFSLPDSIAFHEWALLKREQFTRLVLSALNAITNYYEQNRAYEDALPYAWRLVELDPWDEIGQQQLLRLLAFTAQRGAALAQFEKFRADLDDSLGVSPEKATIDLFELIKTDQLESGLLQAVPQTIQPPTFLEVDPGVPAQQVELFVGRQEELEKLGTHLEKALAGQGHVVFVTGEAGSGKTVLVREFVRQSQAKIANPVAASGNCNAFTGLGDPYLPFREILDGLTGDVEAAWRAGVVTHAQALKLWEILPLAARHITESGPELLETFVEGKALLQRLARTECGAQDWVKELDAIIKRKQDSGSNVLLQTNLFTQYTRLLQLLSRHAPLILFLDDLQWADTGTLSLLFHLGKQLAGCRILVMGAYRPEDVSLLPEGQPSLLSLVHEFQRDYGDILIDLSQASQEAFIHALLDNELNQFGTPFRETLFHQTRGHALFTVELLEGLKVRGDVRKNDAGVWVPAPELNWDVLPPRVEGIIAERIGRIPEHLRQVLTVASVEGEFFMAEVVAEAMSTPAPDILTRLSSQLDKQHGLVRARRVEWVNGQQRSSYRFRHFLFQKYVYSRLDAIERAKLHADIGQALEALSGDRLEESAAQLARHFREAHQIQKAIEYLRMAGERARMWSANTEAIEHYNIALALLQELPESQERHLSEIALQLGLGAAWQALQGYGAEVVGQAYSRALELCQRVEDSPLIYDALWLLWSYYCHQLEFDNASITIDKLLAMAVAQNNTMRILHGHWGLGYLSFRLGDYGQALAHFEKALTLFDPEEHAILGRMTGMDPGIYCNSWAAFFADHLGYFERAESYRRAAMACAEKSTNHLDMALVVTHNAWINDTLGDDQARYAYAEELFRLASKEGFFQYQALACMSIGLHEALCLDNPQKGIGTIKKGMEIMESIGIMDYQILVRLARVYLAAGQFTDGLGCIAQAEAITERTGDATVKAESFTVKGLLYLGQGIVAEAEACFVQAIEVAKQQSARLFELRATIELARLWQSQGKEEGAREQLGQIYERFTEGMDKPILREAKELLDALAQFA